MKPEIVKLAEESFRIAKGSEPKKVFVPDKTKAEEVEISVPKKLGEQSEVAEASGVLRITRKL